LGRRYVNTLLTSNNKFIFTDNLRLDFAWRQCSE
jgi:hypothetical protein